MTCWRDSTTIIRPYTKYNTNCDLVPQSLLSFQGIYKFWNFFFRSKLIHRRKKKHEKKKEVVAILESEVLVNVCGIDRH